MFAARLARLLSVLVTSTAAVMLPVPMVVPAAVAQESCFTGVDFAAMSYGQLTTVVTAGVNSMSPSTPHAEVVAAIGSQIGANASGCSPDQLAALTQNVAAILEELGIVVAGDMTDLLLVAIITPVPTSLEPSTPALVASVY